MIIKTIVATAATALAMLLSGTTQANVDSARVDERSAQEWNFEVFLDDDPIGYHTFRLNPLDNGYELQTEAEFKVKFLFVTAYRYEHENVETWRNGCLERIESSTYDNGDRFQVSGSRDEGNFDVSATGTDGSLETGCVRTFAYWDLDKLKDARLLNAQTGDYLPVDVQPVGRESIEIEGQAVEADRYSLDAEGLDLDLWYSPAGEWLKLTSNVESGRQLRYELVRS